jgi:hypothetical protein
MLSCLFKPAFSQTSYSVSATADTICPGKAVTLSVSGSSGSVAASYSIGSGTQLNLTTDYPCVYGNWYKNTKHEMLYPASELIGAGMTAGNISSLSFFVSQVGTDPVLPDYQISLALTTKTVIPGLFFDSAAPFIQVFHANTYTITAGTNTHSFNAPFYWDGVSGILVQTCYSLSPTYSNNSRMYMSSTSGIMCKEMHGDFLPSCVQNKAMYMYSTRPNIAFGSTVSQPVTYAWQSMPGGPVISTSSVCAVNPTATTVYTVTVTNTGSMATAVETKTITVKPVSTLSLSTTPSLGAVVCNSVGIVSLAGLPAGGYYTAPGLSGNQFDVSTLAEGNYSMKYVLNQNGCKDSISQNIYVSNCYLVWPGDANEDGSVDYMDFMTVNTYTNTSGPARTAATINFVGQPCANWGSTIYNGFDKKFTDCNGDGTINLADTIAVLQNYSGVHALKPQQQATVFNEKLRLEITTDSAYCDELLAVSVFLGEQAYPIQSLYGLGFHIGYDSTLFYPSGASINYAGNFMDPSGLNAVSFSKQVPGKSIVAGAIVNRSQATVSGYGKIGVLHLRPKASSCGRQAIFSIQRSDVIDASFASKNISAVGDSVYLKERTTSIGMKKQATPEELSLFPNPAKEQLTIRSALHGIKSIMIYNALGELVYSASQETASKMVLIPVAQLTSGLYTVRVSVGESNQQMRFLKD